MTWPRLTVPCIWNQSSDCQVVARHQNLEVIMTLAKISLASAAAITIISWGALAQENQNKGRITQLDHINGKITLQHAPAGTVGEVGASSLVDEYKIQDGVASKDLHAVHLRLSTSTKYKTASRPKTCTPATKWTSPQPRLAAS